MALSPGTRLASYEILAAIGVGGMGEVYRARDTQLKRDVAVKVLPDTVARDADRLARFRREAQVLASLNHPNIAAIYGLEEGALVLEFGVVEQLAVMKRGRLPNGGTNDRPALSREEVFRIGREQTWVAAEWAAWAKSDASSCRSQ